MRYKIVDRVELWLVAVFGDIWAFQSEQKGYRNNYVHFDLETDNPLVKFEVIPEFKEERLEKVGAYLLKNIGSEEDPDFRVYTSVSDKCPELAPCFSEKTYKGLLEAISRIVIELGLGGLYAEGRRSGPIAFNVRIFEDNIDEN